MPQTDLSQNPGNRNLNAPVSGLL